MNDGKCLVVFKTIISSPMELVFFGIYETFHLKIDYDNQGDDDGYKDGDGLSKLPHRKTIKCNLPDKNNRLLVVIGYLFGFGSKRERTFAKREPPVLTLRIEETYLKTQCSMC